MAMAIVRDIEPWDELLEAGRTDERLVRQAMQNAKSPRMQAIPDELHPDVRAALLRNGIDFLWSHQAEALYAAAAGPTIVTTGTASGKSLCFNLPVLHTLASDSRARALYLYPTKALAQDQARKLGQLGAAIDKQGRGRAATLRHAIYDGDTPGGERRQIRERANLVLSNPDMLNQGVLPNHRQWADFFANLAWIVV